MKRIVRPLSILLTLLLLVSLCACGGDKAAVYVSFDQVGKVVFSAGRGYTLMGWNMTAVDYGNGALANGVLEPVDTFDGTYEFNVIDGDQQEFTLYYCPEGKEDEETSITAIVTKGDGGTVSFEWENLPDGVLGMK